MNWIDRFFTFFREIEPTLAVVLNANSCREGWLQGELYRHFRTDENGFEVNRRYRAGGVPFDLYSPAPPPMVAEVKVYGERGYFTKNLCGWSNIRQFLPQHQGPAYPSPSPRSRRCSKGRRGTVTSGTCAACTPCRPRSSGT